MPNKRPRMSEEEFARYERIAEGYDINAPIGQVVAELGAERKRYDDLLETNGQACIQAEDRRIAELEAEKEHLAGELTIALSGNYVARQALGLKARAEKAEAERASVSQSFAELVGESETLHFRLDLSEKAREKAETERDLLQRALDGLVTKDSRGRWSGFRKPGLAHETRLAPTQVELLEDIDKWRRDNGQ